jgi:hypothetical protein
MAGAVVAFEASDSIFSGDPSSTSAEYFARRPLELIANAAVTARPDSDPPFLRAVRVTAAKGEAARTVSRGPISHFVEYGVRGTTSRLNEYEARRIMVLGTRLLDGDAAADREPRLREFTFDFKELAMRASRTGAVATLTTEPGTDAQRTFPLGSFLKTLSTVLEDLDAVRNAVPLPLP